VKVWGQTVDEQTRCVHYRSHKDIIAIKFACCGRYYPCHLCHEEAESHQAMQWQIKERGTKAILCGACSTELTVAEYLKTDRCPYCCAPFNERCGLHAHLYFEM
jgi:uncharacterized CHY-type Zn-finger protein